MAKYIDLENATKEQLVEYLIDYCLSLMTGKKMAWMTFGLLCLEKIQATLYGRDYQPASVRCLPCG